MTLNSFSEKAKWRQKPLIRINLRCTSSSIDRACLEKKSVRKDEKTLFWPPSIITRLGTKSMGNKTAQ